MIKKDNNKIKLLINGNLDVGKSSLIHRFVGDEFYEKTIKSNIQQFFNKSIFIRGEAIDLQITDVLIEEEWIFLDVNHYYIFDGILFVYDVTDCKTFGSVVDWVKLANHFGPENCLKYIVASKIDLEHKIEDLNIVKSYANKMDFKFFETSSKYSINVEETFVSLAEDILIKKNYQFNNNQDEH
ncbi:hypothetical protein ACTFIZ_002898 [Dictyostelium cf. discoideum]